MYGLDTHADISCAGRDACILAQVEGRTCSVHPFNEFYKAMTGINIVNVAYKYENDEGDCRGSSRDTIANKINPYF